MPQGVVSPDPIYMLPAATPQGPESITSALKVQTVTTQAPSHPRLDLRTGSHQGSRTPLSSPPLATALSTRALSKVSCDQRTRCMSVGAVGRQPAPQLPFLSTPPVSKVPWPPLSWAEGQTSHQGGTSLSFLEDTADVTKGGLLYN